MNALEHIFPDSKNILCTWHVEKNILAKCKNYFHTEEEWVAFIRCWTEVVKSRTEKDFATQWSELCAKYDKNPLIVNYIQGTWLPFKERFVSAWVDRHLHLGNIATSRVEGDIKKVFADFDGRLTCRI